MFLLVDHLHRLSQSPAAAAWLARISGAIAIVALARLFLLVAGGPQLPLLASHALAPASLERSPVSSWHLFGVPGAETALEATTLSLTLRGTLASDKPDRGLAIIAEKGQKDAGYHVGETLPGGGVLEAIHPDHVVILNGGKRESLALIDPRANRTASNPDTSSILPANAPNPIIAASIAASSTPDPGTSANTYSAALGTAIGPVSVMPVIENGKVIGARLATADVASIERVGLRRDDVIVSIDGSAIDDPQINGKIENRLRAGIGMTLVVRRDGRERTVRVGK